MNSLSSTFAGSIVVAPKNRSLRCLAVFFTLLLGVFLAQAVAQEATIVGTVTDPSGAAVPNVTITITNSDTGQVRKLSTNADGQYDWAQDTFSVRPLRYRQRADCDRTLTWSELDRQNPIPRRELERR